MSEKSESSARVITFALKELTRIAEEGNLPMLAYLLEIALIEARAQGGEAGSDPNDNILRLVRN